MLSRVIAKNIGDVFLRHSVGPISMAWCIAHARNGHISTFAFKSDVTIVFHHPHFLYYPISYKSRKCRQFAYKYGSYIAFFSVRMRETAIFTFGLKYYSVHNACFRAVYFVSVTCGPVHCLNGNTWITQLFRHWNALAMEFHVD